MRRIVLTIPTYSNYQAQVQRMISDGHQVGSHTYVPQTVVAKQNVLGPFAYIHLGGRTPIWLRSTQLASHLR